MDSRQIRRGDALPREPSIPDDYLRRQSEGLMLLCSGRMIALSDRFEMRGGWAIARSLREARRALAA